MTKQIIIKKINLCFFRHEYRIHWFFRPLLWMTDFLHFSHYMFHFWIISLACRHLLAWGSISFHSVDNFPLYLFTCFFKSCRTFSIMWSMVRWGSYRISFFVLISTLCFWSSWKIKLRSSNRFRIFSLFHDRMNVPSENLFL